MLDLQMSIMRQERVPIRDAMEVNADMVAAIRGVIIASKLSEDEKNSIFDELRDLKCIAEVTPNGSNNFIVTAQHPEPVGAVSKAT